MREGLYRDVWLFLYAKKEGGEACPKLPGTKNKRQAKTMNESVGPGREMRGHKKEENMKYRNNDYSRGLTVPMNLQFFADGSAGGGGESGNAAGGEGIQPGSGDGGSETREPEGEGSRAAGGAVSFDDFLKDPKTRQNLTGESGKRWKRARARCRRKLMPELRRQGPRLRNWQG